MSSSQSDRIQDPFGPELELDYFYISASLDSVCQQVFADVSCGEGAVLISGEPGMGKSFFLKSLLHNLDKKVKFYSLGNNDVIHKSFSEIVNQLCHFLEIDTEDMDFFENILALDRYLNQPGNIHTRVALVIDDADQLSDEILKKLLMLSVAPLPDRGSLQIILTGESNLKSRVLKIQLPADAELKISSYQLQKLSEQEVRYYIDKRLQTIGQKIESQFKPEAIEKIVSHSKGIPALINILCSLSLKKLAGEKKPVVTKKIVEKVIKDAPVLERISLKKTDEAGIDELGSATTIEKFYHRLTYDKQNAQNEETAEQETKPDYVTASGYFWGFGVIMLLLFIMFLFSPADNILEKASKKDLMANTNESLPQAKAIEQSDQAVLSFEEASNPSQSSGPLKPLLMPGKKSLFQKVLTQPGAILYQQPKVTSFDAIPLPAFSVYYVYLRLKDDSGREWVQVGLGRKGNLAGWITTDSVQDWNQGLTLSFKDPGKQDRVMLFKDKSSLIKLAENYDIETYKKLHKEATQGKVGKDSPVVAIQPDKHIDFNRNFYLLPIQDHEQIYLNNEVARLLKVSSVARKEKPIKKIAKNVGDSNISNHEAISVPSNSYKAGITFVIDSTFSMQPFIDRTREAVAKIYGTLEKADLIGQVNFGLIAFRDNTDVVPGIEYLTRQYVSLKQGENPQTFMAAVNGLKAAEISSRGFIEDSYAGISKALKDLDWSPFAARYIILITDAGAREAGDPLASTGLTASRLKRLAQENNAAIFVMHILTPDPQADHKLAERQYRTVSHYPGIGSFYYGVPTTSLEEFGSVIEQLAKQITYQVSTINGGKKVPFEPEQHNPRLIELQRKVAKLGHALELQYLQKTGQGKIPDVFSAWVLDKDFKHPEKPALEVRALLTRDQLSDLHDVLKKVLETARQGQVSPKQFLDELKSLAATLMRDPKQLGTTTSTTSGQPRNLAEMGFMREYIEDLPYTGEIMNVSLEDWQTWSATRQGEFLKRLQDKINYYQKIHDNVDLWVSLDGEAIDGDAVYALPLEMLP